MIIIKLTLNYIRANFLFLLIIAVAPVAMYVLNDTAFTVLTFFEKVRGGYTTFRFTTVYKYLSLINFTRPIYSLLSFAVTAVFMAILAAFIEKHMRIGRRSLRGLLFKVNDNIMPILFLLAAFMLIYEVFLIVLAAVLVMASLMLTNVVALYIVCGLLLLLFYGLLFLVMSTVALWLPCTIITGFTFGEAFAYSLNLLSGRFNMFIAAVFPLAVGALIGAAAQLIFGQKAAAIVRIVNFAFYFIYYNVLMFTAYFQATNEPREDLKKKYF